MIEKFLQALKGLVRVTFKTMRINMFNKSGDTYHIEKVEIKIDVHVAVPVVETESQTTEQIETQTQEK